MYSYDTTIYSQFYNAGIADHDIELEINNELSNINDWLKINKSALNIKKNENISSQQKHTLNQNGSN